MEAIFVLFLSKLVLSQLQNLEAVTGACTSDHICSYLTPKLEALTEAYTSDHILRYFYVTFALNPKNI